MPMEETKAHLVTVATFLLSAVLGAKRQASLASENKHREYCHVHYNDKHRE